MSMVKKKYHLIKILDDDHVDIKFLKMKLERLIFLENYEEASVLRDWIKELYKHHHDINKI